MDLDILHESAVLAAVVAKSITVNLYLATFYNINPLFSNRLEKPFIGGVKRFLQLAGHVSLHILGPPAKEENAILDNGQRLLIDDHAS